MINLRFYLAFFFLLFFHQSVFAAACTEPRMCQFFNYTTGAMQETACTGAGGTPAGSESYAPCDAPPPLCLDGSPAPYNDPAHCQVCGDGSPIGSGGLAACTKTCPDGSVVLQSQACPEATKTCPDGSVIPIADICPSNDFCPDGTLKSAHPNQDCNQCIDVNQLGLCNDDCGAGGIKVCLHSENGVCTQSVCTNPGSGSNGGTGCQGPLNPAGLCDDDCPVGQVKVQVSDGSTACSPICAGGTKTPVYNAQGKLVCSDDAAGQGAVGAAGSSDPTTAANNNTGATNANTSATNANTSAANANTQASKSNTTAVATNTSATTTNTSALTSNTSATNANTAATNANTAAANALKSSLEAGVASQGANTTATDSNTAALNANTAAQGQSNGLLASISSGINSINDSISNIPSTFGGFANHDALVDGVFDSLADTVEPPEPPTDFVPSTFALPPDSAGCQGIHAQYKQIVFDFNPCVKLQPFRDAFGYFLYITTVISIFRVAVRQPSS